MNRFPLLKIRLLRAALAVAIVMVVGYASHDYWLPRLTSGNASSDPRPLAVRARQASFDHAHTHDHHGHAHGDGHDHAHDDEDHPGHDEASALRLSEQARQNIKLQVEQIRLQPFVRTVTLPGMVVQRPGRSQIAIPSPMTGIVTRIYHVQGEAVVPGQPLFDVRLTHEELVTTQSEFLAAAEEIDVVRREVERLQKVSAQGVIAGKTLLERQYELQKLEAVLHAKRQGLLLHGLTDAQIDQILTTRNLLRDITITAPASLTESEPIAGNAAAGNGAAQKFFNIQQLDLQQGQHITKGDTLCVLADHDLLFIEGHAFESDAERLSHALQSGWNVTAQVASSSDAPRTVEDLPILYVNDQIDPESRILHFYVTLPNEVLRDTATAGKRFVTWRFKPGQRVKIFLPVETWEDRIVLPVEAVINEGAETFVFERYGTHFDRVPVRIEYRDQRWAVITPSAQLQPGDVVATHGAYQMHLAIKNKAGGAIDPHAGHNH